MKNIPHYYKGFSHSRVFIEQHILLICNGVLKLRRVFEKTIAYKCSCLCEFYETECCKNYDKILKNTDNKGDTDFENLSIVGSDNDNQSIVGSDNDNNDGQDDSEAIVISRKQI